MWMYSGLGDTTRIHPKEVDDDTLEKWLSGMTGNKDNPGEPGEFLHSTSPMYQRRSNSELLIVI